jgi:hypothetical protein
LVDPLFWLALSLLLVAVSLTAVLLVAIPAMRELSRAARSAEKLFDTLGHELPPTLEAIRRTGLEIAELTDDLGEGVQSAGRVVKQVDQGLGAARQQAQTVTIGSRTVLAGMLAAWQAWSSQGDRPTPRPRPKKLGHQRPNLPESRPRSEGSRLRANPPTAASRPATEEPQGELSLSPREEKTLPNCDRTPPQADPPASISADPWL